jgi:choline-sulfatase
MLLAVLIACASQPVAPPLVLVTLDTFRADHTGAIGGYPRPVETPNLDALAARGRLYAAAWTEVPLTLPSHTAMLTGRSALEVGVFSNHQAVPGDARTVAEDLREAGWRTGAFISSAVLAEEAGLARGFETYDDFVPPMNRIIDKIHERRADDTVDRALRWLSRAPGPSFLWVHLYDPHAPYAPPRPYRDAYDPTPEDAPGSRAEVLASLEAAPRRLLRFSPLDLRRQLALYAGEISWTDHQLGRLLEGLPEGARVVVAGDHGESLTEHGYLLNHGVLLYEPSLHVPLVVAGPGVAPGVEGAPVSTVQVAATLRELAGLPAEGPMGSLLGPPPEEVFAFATPASARVALRQEPLKLVAWRRGEEKWIVGSDGVVERFDLAVDPGEARGAQPADAAAWRWRAHTPINRLFALEGTAAPISSERSEALEALGYVE